MVNQELAKIFHEMADYLETDEVPFKPYAYRKVADALECLDEDVKDIYKLGGTEELEKINGVGKGIAKAIEEYIKTGKIKGHIKLKKQKPFNITELTSVEGLGPRKVKILFQKLGIRNVKDLEKAASAKKIAPLFGFDEKTEKNILQGIEFLKRDKGRFLLNEILSETEKIIENLKKLKDIEQISIAGSLRRMKETIGDVDILIATKNSKKVMDFFVNFLEKEKKLERIWGKGTTKTSVRLRQGFDVDIRVVNKKSYGSALQYFTGSKEHNIATRKIAMSKNLKLSEYGLFKGKKIVAGWDERGIYRKLGMSFIEPELRENQGEIEAALSQAQGKVNGLPKLVNQADIRGDLHCHCHWNINPNGIKQAVNVAMDMGYEYLGVTDHTKFLRIEHGLNEKQLSQQRKEIDKLNTKYLSCRQAGKLKNKKFCILQGAETNVLADGSIDINDEALKKLDYAIAGIHSGLKMDRDKMTERIIRAMKNPYIKILSHPTGRILQKRDEYSVDFDKILRAAKEYGVVLEINAYPARLDLSDVNVRRAKEAGVKMIINADAHQTEHLDFMKFGVAQARRGWAEKNDIVNAWPLDKLLKYLNSC